MIAANTSALTYHLDNLNIVEALEKLKELGFKNLEVGYSHPLEELKKYKNDFNFISYHHFTELNLDEDFEAIEEEFQEPIKICNEMEIKFLSFHPHFKNDRERAIQNLSRLEDLMPQELCIENFPRKKKGFLLESPGDFERIKNACDNIGILLDVGHISPGDFKDYIELENHIKTVHMQDVFPELGIEHLPLGAGKMDFSFLEKLVEKPWILELKYGGPELLKVSRLKAKELKEKFQGDEI